MGSERLASSAPLLVIEHDASWRNKIRTSPNSLLLQREQVLRETDKRDFDLLLFAGEHDSFVDRFVMRRSSGDFSIARRATS
jgi:hypothetical protein